jgi:hypothetical protein
LANKKQLINTAGEEKYEKENKIGYGWERVSYYMSKSYDGEINVQEKDKTF